MPRPSRTCAPDTSSTRLPPSQRLVSCTSSSANSDQRLRLWSETTHFQFTYVRLILLRKNVKCCASFPLHFWCHLSLKSLSDFPPTFLQEDLLGYMEYLERSLLLMLALCVFLFSIEWKLVDTTVIKLTVKYLIFRSNWTAARLQPDPQWNVLDEKLNTDCRHVVLQHLQLVQHKRKNNI